MSGTSWTLWVQPLSDTLLQLLWQLGVLGALAAVLLHTLRHSAARLRYAVCALVLLLSLMLAALQFVARWAEVQTPSAVPAAQAIWGSGAINAQSHSAVQAQQSEEPDPWAMQRPWRQGLAWAWLLGVALMSLRLLAGVACVARWRRRSRPAPALWQSRLDQLARRMGMGLSVELRLLPAAVDVAAGPFTVGWWRPVVLLPAGLLTGLPTPLLEALLAHELAHVRRWDYLAHLLQKVVEALLFFHPVIWWLSRRLRIERELVADALAAEQLGAPRQLAEALQALAVGPQAPALAAAAQSGELAQRVRALIRRSPAVGDGPRLLCALLLLSLLAGSLLLPLVGVQSATAQAAVARGAPAAPLAEGRILLADLTLASSHALVLDADSGEVLLARDAQQAAPIASISKLMTALVVLDARQDLQQQLSVSSEDVRASPFSSASLRPGQRLSREAALTLMLQSSDNRAAQLLARRYPGGLAAFERATQDKARSLGLQTAELRHPTGAPSSSRASAADVARLLEAAASEPVVRQATGAARVRVLVDGKPIESIHSNPLVGAPGWPMLLAKTGFTQAAGRCVALQMRLQGRRLSVVLLGAPDAAQREADLQRIRDALQG
ncbi:M56 family metallopeptidase [Paucibacter sp. PLA-PC-4]|uniref:M56 family metallopeptidase n=1 Tax=Paucibacter sp. PLA-PC-4 TaxID=2993655 RepID=UPI002248A87D|nr:M56 family metallopeptidase [Paucibacter sp. PLA-PC-4]MCX2861028.1 M56 family metallopeptidase [Paucibacter sp. PLA-PC-4]